MSQSGLCDKDEYARDLLAQAYCLRALCTQEAEPNSEHFVQDIGNALKQWLHQKHPQSAEQTLSLLYHVGDLLSLKGYMEHHSDMYEMMFKILKWKDVPLKECITILWQSRRLRHCLCTSPVSDSFIKTLSKRCSSSKCMEFWISCMERSNSLGVGFKQCLSVISTLSSPGSHNHEHATQPLATVDDVKQAASDLTSQVSPSRNSFFLAAHLYYDLCERVMAKGSMIEAQMYAKEAHCLRYKLFHQTFTYSTDTHNGIFGDNGKLIEERGFRFTSFHMHPSVAVSAWSSHDMNSSDLVECILTPWNVLQCYLETLLQRGTIEEIIGNGSDAERCFRWGKTISLFNGLPIFLVSFSLALGQLYRKQKKWRLAHNELKSANRTLADSDSLVSCSKCKLVLQATKEKQLADLCRSFFHNTIGNKLHQVLSMAAVEKLKRTEWKNCVSHPNIPTSSNKILCDSLMIGRNDVNMASTFGNEIEQEEILPRGTRKGKKTARKGKKTARKGKKTAKPQEQSVTSTFKKGIQMSKPGCMTCGGCICDDKDCWHCLSYGVMKSLSMDIIIQMKWEITRRRLLLRLLTGIGKCLMDIEETKRAHNIFLESISVLVSRSTFCPSQISISFSFLAELIKKNVTGDVFAVEHASLLYTICCFSARSSWDKGTRNDCCDLFIPMPTILSGLKLSFILCREVPELFQKVSRLLSVLYTLSSSNKNLGVLFTSTALCESQWASFFLQASVGADFNYQLFSHLGKSTDNITRVDGASVTNSTRLSLHRLAPESVMDLEEFIINFFANLPRATIVCISVLGDTYARFLSKLMPYEYSARAWIVFSRFNSDRAPIVIALPLGSVLRGCLEDDQDLRSCVLPSPAKSWRCPWDHTVIDEVAPLFRSILEKSYATTSVITEDTNENRKVWWAARDKLDNCLADLLRYMEDLWFGPWIYLFLGGALDSDHLDSVTKNLMQDLKSMCKIDISESILSSVVSSVVSCASSQRKKCLSELILNKGCYIDDGSPKESSLTLSSLLDKFITNEIREIGDEAREPVILVLDFDIQMLPWESMPLLKNKEVYRMPSIASISCTCNRRVQEKVGEDFAVFPMIDPLDAYYVLNPDGDLSGTEATFNNWFKKQKLEGTSGTSPTVDKLTEALKNHDLFIYLGHGSGLQYISADEIQKLDGCAAAVLMGCSSGSLYLKKSCTPRGAPISYLYAGAAFIIANLWDVTDKDIDLFSKSLLNSLITAASSNSSLDCAQCTEIVNNFKVGDVSTFVCKHRPKVGSFMGKARQACKLKSINGAATVCYGVPTVIRKK